MTAPAPAGTFTTRRINTLMQALGTTRYLEIGVYEGATFFGVAAPRKVAVDPQFRFDRALRDLAGATFHEITSDAYFTTVNGGEVFDLVFIDGLHTFEQTLRDFCNSLACSHRGTVWIIDDTVPNDVYSALRDWQETHRFRRQANNPDTSWHGDVYKVAFALHDFFPMLSYCTINTDGNPQTVVWHQPRAGFRPLFDNLETISRLTYFDFRRHGAAMNFMDEASGLRHVLANVPRRP